MRVLIANEKRERLGELTGLLEKLGHQVVASEVDVQEIAEATEREHPDVALVDLGSSSEHALGLISEIVREAYCPVIALLSTGNQSFVSEAARRGIFAYIVNSTPEELQNALDITLQRFTEYHNLRGAFGRRAIIEQAKGIMMARHAIDAEQAFTMLREYSQHNGLKLQDVANGVITFHELLMPAMKIESQFPIQA